MDVALDYVFTCYTIGDLDTEGFIYDQNCNLLFSDDDSGTGTNFHFSFDNTAVPYGSFVDYFVIAIKAYNNRDTGGYILVAEKNILYGAVPVTPYDDIHGDTFSTATEVELGSATDGALYPITDKDYFKIQVPSPGRLNITYSSTSVPSNFLDADIYDSSGTLHSSANLERSGTYYICISTPSWPETYGHGEYTLFVDFVGDGSNDDSDNNVDDDSDDGDDDSGDDDDTPVTPTSNASGGGGGGGSCFLRTLAF